MKAGTNRLNEIQLESLLYPLGLIARGEKLQKLVKAACQDGCQEIRDSILSCVIKQKLLKRRPLQLLLEYGAKPENSLGTLTNSLILPTDNLITIIRSTNNHLILKSIENRLNTDIAGLERHWKENKFLLQLLIECDCRLHLILSTFLYRHHSDIYKLYKSKRYRPRSLKSLCRFVVRNCLQPNVFYGLRILKAPPRLRYVLLLQDIA